MSLTCSNPVLGRCLYLQDTSLTLRVFICSGLDTSTSCLGLHCVRRVCLNAWWKLFLTWNYLSQMWLFPSHSSHFCAISLSSEVSLDCPISKCSGPPFSLSPYPLLYPIFSAIPRSFQSGLFIMTLGICLSWPRYDLHEDKTLFYSHTGQCIKWKHKFILGQNDFWFNTYKKFESPSKTWPWKTYTVFKNCFPPKWT